MPPSRALALVAIALAVAAACSPVTEQTVVRARASADMPCPEPQIQVGYVSGSLYRASGCGKQALYDCVGEGRNIRCTASEARDATR